MDLYRELLIRVTQEESIEILFPDFNLNALLESRCYQALCEIKGIIDDDTLEDDACFQKIEEIICTLEFLESSGGFRHDFG